MSSTIRHPDFEKIHTAFLTHYSKDPSLGESRYADWVKFSGLDDSQSYYLQGAARANKSNQSFEWAKFLIEFVKEDKDAFYYKVEALFPVESMNKDSPPFTRDEIFQAARSLTGKPSDLNHDDKHPFPLQEVEVVAAQFEGDCVECLVRILKTSVLVGMIDRKEIVNVSIEGEWSHGIPGHGLVLNGLGWLTKDTMLPGIPLTRIMPVERIAESFKAEVVKEAVKEQAGVVCAVCGSLADFVVSICTQCLENAKGAAPDPAAAERLHVHSLKGVEVLEEKQIVELAEKVAAKLGEKSSVEMEKLKTEFSLAEAKLKAEVAEALKKVTEAEGRAKVAEGACTEANGKLAVANKAVEAFKKAVPGADLMANIPVLMPVTEHIAVLEKLLPPAVVEHSTTSMQRQGQVIRAAVFQAKEKLKAN